MHLAVTTTTFIACAAFVIGVYGAAVSTFMAHAAWRRDRQDVRLTSRAIRGSVGDRVEIIAFNRGHRPVTVVSAHFETDDHSGYLMTLDENLGLPRKLESADRVVFPFDLDDILPSTVGFVLRSDEAEYRHDFDEHLRSFLSNE